MRKLKVPDPRDLIRNRINFELNDHDFVTTLQQSMEAGKSLVPFVRELYLKQLKTYVKRKGSSHEKV